MDFNRNIACQAVLIAAPGSGHGKTVFTASLARRYIKDGKKVQIFKVGPDYIDPTILECASNNTVYNFDVWMMGEFHCRNMLHQAAMTHDVILIESLMGLYDNEPNNAQLSMMFDLPIILIINVKQFTQTISAIIHGLVNYHSKSRQLKIIGVVGNCVVSDSHHRLIKNSVEVVTNYLGSLPNHHSLSIPKRHLGLVQGQELKALNIKFSKAATFINQSNIQIALKPVIFKPVNTNCFSIQSLKKRSQSLKKRRIAIANDLAFSFIYPDNLKILKDLGAQYVFFSPLNNDPVPDCDAMWIPGGYPELYLSLLSKNKVTQDFVLQHIQKNKPTLAECGGMMYLSKSIKHIRGRKRQMCGIFNATCHIKKQLQNIGLQIYSTQDGELRGHSFHYSQLTTSLSSDSIATTRSNGNLGEPVYRLGKTTLSYIHFCFSSNPTVTASLFS